VGSKARALKGRVPSSNYGTAVPSRKMLAEPQDAVDRSSFMPTLKRETGRAKQLADCPSSGYGRASITLPQHRLTQTAALDVTRGLSPEHTFRPALLQTKRHQGVKTSKYGQSDPRTLVSEKAQRIAALKAKHHEEFIKTKPKLRYKPKRMDKGPLKYKPPVMEPARAGVEELLNMNRNVLRNVTDARKLLAAYSQTSADGSQHAPELDVGGGRNQTTAGHRSISEKVQQICEESRQRAKRTAENRTVSLEKTRLLQERLIDLHVELVCLCRICLMHVCAACDAAADRAGMYMGAVCLPPCLACSDAASLYRCRKTALPL